MTEDQIASLAPGFTAYLECFRPYFATKDGFAHLRIYTRGLISDLKRKSVEPIALAGGAAVRTLQEFLTFHVWDEDAIRDKLQRRVVARHLPAPGVPGDSLGTIGIVDETSVVKKGTKTPGVQRQWCGAAGKTENCVVTVHLGCRQGKFKTLLDSDLYLPKSWSEDRQRCRDAGIPDTLVYRPKWMIAVEQIKRAIGNGVRLDWVVFDEGYGGKNPYLFELDALGLHWIGEVPKNFPCWPTLPKYRSLQAPFASKRADNATTHSRVFHRKKWRRFKIPRETEKPQCWLAKAARVHLVRDGNPTQRKYWLIVAHNQKTGEVKYFVSNAPPRTALDLMLRVAFQRWNVEHAFRVVKSEIGFTHYEGRNYLGLMRHMILCMMVMLFLAEQLKRFRGEKGTETKSNGDHSGAGGRCVQPPLPSLVGATDPPL